MFMNEVLTHAATVDRPQDQGAILHTGNRKQDVPVPSCARLMGSLECSGSFLPMT